MFDYDPHTSGDVKPEYVPVDLVPQLAARNLRTPGPLKTFNAIYNTAIDMGMTSEQKICELVGKEALEALRSPKSNPSPAQRRLVLQFIATLDPENATMKKEPWRHASRRPKEERTPQL